MHFGLCIRPPKIGLAELIIGRRRAVLDRPNLIWRGEATNWAGVILEYL